jgi:hypothetical protein
MRDWSTRAGDRLCTCVQRLPIAKSFSRSQAMLRNSVSAARRCVEDDCTPSSLRCAYEVVRPTGAARHESIFFVDATPAHSTFACVCNMHYQFRACRCSFQPRRPLVVRVRLDSFIPTKTIGGFYTGGLAAKESVSGSTRPCRNSHSGTRVLFLPRAWGVRYTSKQNGWSSYPRHEYTARRDEYGVREKTHKAEKADRRCNHVDRVSTNSTRQRCRDESR